MELAYARNAVPDLIYHSSWYRIPKRPRGSIVVNVNIYFRKRKLYKFTREAMVDIIHKGCLRLI